jgi:hypothetical protein
MHPETVSAVKIPLPGPDYLPANMTAVLIEIRSGFQFCLSDVRPLFNCPAIAGERVSVQAGSDLHTV